MAFFLISGGYGRKYNGRDVWVGCYFTVNTRDKDLVAMVTSLGRWCFSGSTQVHEVAIFRGVGDGRTGTKIGSIGVNAKYGRDGYVYADLSEPIILHNNATYILASREYRDGDSFYMRSSYNEHYDMTLYGSAYGRSDPDPDADDADVDTYEFRMYADNQSFGPCNFRFDIVEDIDFENSSESSDVYSSESSDAYSSSSSTSSTSSSSTSSGFKRGRTSSSSSSSSSIDSSSTSSTSSSSTSSGFKMGRKSSSSSSSSSSVYMINTYAKITTFASTSI